MRNQAPEKTHTVLRQLMVLCRFQNSTMAAKDRKGMKTAENGQKPTKKIAPDDESVGILLPSQYA